MVAGLREEGKEIRGLAVFAKLRRPRRSEGRGDGSDNLLLALHFAAGHSEAINVSHIL